MTQLTRTASALALVFSLALAGGGAAASQSIWRCEGNSYSSQPCSGGRLLDATDTRSDSDQRAAREVVERDRRLARDMAQDRQEREREWRQAAGTGLTGFGLPMQHAAADIKPKDRNPSQAKRTPTQKMKLPKAQKPPTGPTQFSSVAGT
jgi:hypothetical protein